MPPACDFQRFTACYPRRPGETPYEGAAGTTEQLGGKTTVKLTYMSQDHGPYDHPSCHAPAADDYLLNGKIPMYGAGCS